MSSTLFKIAASAGALLLASSALAQATGPAFGPDGSVVASPGPTPSPGTNTPAMTLPYTLQTTPNGSRPPGRAMAPAPVPAPQTQRRPLTGRAKSAPARSTTHRSTTPPPN
jgi:hypothetical protein